jgi:hypothetical protein
MRRAVFGLAAAKCDTLAEQHMPWRKFCLISALVFMLGRPTASNVPLPSIVSMVQLIATPEKFDGKVVLVVGFLRLEFEGNCLYLHKEDYEHSITKNGLWVVRNPVINAKSEALNMHYVLVLGTFNATNKGHMDLSSGSLTDIRAASLWPPAQHPLT